MSALIVRVGVDLASVGTVTESLRQFGPRYVRRIYTSRELSDCTVGGRPAAHRLAARFAAKEAVVKALGLAREAAVDWTEIEVVDDGDGRPRLGLTGHMAAAAAACGLTTWAVSLADTETMAAAIVVGS